MLLWLQGGPGGSSLFGLFVENGPIGVDVNANCELQNKQWMNENIDTTTGKEGNVLFNEALNTFYVRFLWRWTFGKRSLSEKRNPLPPLHGLLFFWFADLLYAQSYRQDNTFHSFCYTSCGTLAGMRNSSVGPPWGIDLMTHITMSWCSTIINFCVSGIPNVPWFFIIL